MVADRAFTRILVPTDFSSCAEKAWGVAQRLASAVGAELTLLHVLVEAHPFSEGPFSLDRVRELMQSVRQWADEQLEQWGGSARAAGLVVRTEIRTGAAHRQIVAAARDLGADLVVIGTHGHGGLDRALLGSVADRVIRTAPCPVMAVREPT
jgi:nucleotide-binding universal stress UspA family protein